MQKTLDFIREVEEFIFSNESIYRMIIIVNDKFEQDILANYLVTNDYCVFSIDHIDNSIDYNKIDERILMMKHDLFDAFIDFMENHNSGIINSSYNCIGLNYSIDEETGIKIKESYLFCTKNNITETIIFDKQYVQSKYFSNMILKKMSV